MQNSNLSWASTDGFWYKVFMFANTVNIRMQFAFHDSSWFIKKLIILPPQSFLQVFSASKAHNPTSIISPPFYPLLNKCSLKTHGSIWWACSGLYRMIRPFILLALGSSWENNQIHKTNEEIGNEYSEFLIVCSVPPWDSKFLAMFKCSWRNITWNEIWYMFLFPFLGHVRLRYSCW